MTDQEFADAVAHLGMLHGPYKDFPAADVRHMAPKGWWGILARLMVDLHRMGWDGTLSQVKEKFGGLRFYVGPSTVDIHDRVDEAEGESLKTCEECGSPGHPRAGGWVLTLCDEHAFNSGPVKESHLREMEWEE